MITKKIIPIGNIYERDGKKVMKVVKMIAEYRLFGILLYRKELLYPTSFGADYFDDFTVQF